MSHRAAVIHSLRPGLGQTDSGIPAEADVAAAAVDGETLHPGLGSARLHDEVQRRVGAVATRFCERLDSGGGELSHGEVFPTFFPTRNVGSPETL